MARILALSSSRAGNSGYLEKAAPLIVKFLGNKEVKIGFIPFASVDRDYEQYGSMVRQALSNFPYHIEVLDGEMTESSFNKIDAVMVGGGNTFKLLHDLYYYKIIDRLRESVKNGLPYIGWSAGANLTGRTIGTTNDMPIIEPQSFNALQLFPFQINPHYLNQKPEGFHGETRDQRLEEFSKMNPGIPIVGLPEGTALNMENDNLHYLGTINGVLFRTNKEGYCLREEITPGQDLSFLL